MVHGNRLLSLLILRLIEYRANIAATHRFGSVWLLHSSYAGSNWVILRL